MQECYHFIAQKNTEDRCTWIIRLVIKVHEAKRLQKTLPFILVQVNIFDLVILDGNFSLINVNCWSRGRGMWAGLIYHYCSHMYN